MNQINQINNNFISVDVESWPNMNSFSKFYHKSTRDQNQLKSEEVDFLKTRISHVLNSVEDTAVQLKAKAMILKREGDKESAQKFFNELKKVKNEYKKIAEIQRKLKRGLR